MQRQTKTKRSAKGNGSARKATVSATSKPTEEEIRYRAYLISQERGGMPGDPVADWLQAERSLSEDRKKQTVTGKVKPARKREATTKIKTTAKGKTASKSRSRGKGRGAGPTMG